MKRLEGVVLLGAITIVGALGISGSSSALEYQTNPSTGDNPVTLKFEFGSTLTINTDGNIAISNLTPGTANVSSSSYRVTVNTNNVAGYTLTATVGCSTGTNCYNNKTLSDGTNTFSMVTSTSGTALTAGEWGFATSGSATATSSVFKTLALYSDTTPTTLNKTKDATGTAYDNTFAGNTTTPFQIGAYATTSQVAGTYTNVINFIAVPNPVPEYIVTLSTSDADTIIIDGVSYTNGDTPSLTQGTHTISGTYPVGFTSWSSTGGVSVTNASTANTTINVTGTGTLILTGAFSGIYMQDMTMTQCQKNVVDNIGENVTVYDKRDGNDYTVKYINGKCWMTQNLRFIDTSVLSETSNVLNNKNLTYYQLDTDGVENGKCYYANGLNYACIKDSGSTSIGAWYNYYAATAGTIIGASNSNAAYQDICPKNWHLPSGPSSTSGTDYNILAGNTQQYWQDATPGFAAFDAVAGGYYNFGSLEYTSRGYYWSANASSATNRYYLYYDTQFNASVNDGRQYGEFIRCVKSE